MKSLHDFLFGLYPYIALSVFFIGSLIRFDREQYSWKSDSSQILRKSQLRLGSMLFHLGVLVVFFGHLIGFLMPEPIVLALMSERAHELLAMGGGRGGRCVLHHRAQHPDLPSGQRSTHPEQ